jgi:hypothetical protein
MSNIERLAYRENVYQTKGERDVRRLCTGHFVGRALRAGASRARPMLPKADGQGIQNLLRLLPSVAFWVVELFGPLIRIFESTMEDSVGWTIHLMAPMAAHILVFRRHFGSRLRERAAHSHAAPHHCDNGHNRQYLVFHFAPLLFKTLAKGEWKHQQWMG